MTIPINDVDHWLETNGIKRKWADAIANQVKKQYPYLGQAVRESKGNSTNRAELDLILLVYHTLQGRFPIGNEDKRFV